VYYNAQQLKFYFFEKGRGEVEADALGKGRLRITKIAGMRDIDMNPAENRSKASSMLEVDSK